jgi:hypothetical protein
MPSGENMEAQDLPSQDEHAEKVMESIGVSDDSPEIDKHAEETQETSEGSHSKETLAVQKRLKALNRAHEREVRGLQSRIGELEAKMSQPNTSHEQPVQSNMPPIGGNIDEHIHKAVSYALQAKDAEERKAREAQSMAHVNRQYQEFHKHLDSMGDKYDDFHDVVLGDHTPFTTHMRDYSLTLPRMGSGSAGEVLYKLGKNPEELKRISNLHPLDQASELAKLSHALIKGGESKGSQSQAPLGNIKSNPVVNSHAISDKTPISSLRERMKSGSWK